MKRQNIAAIAGLSLLVGIAASAAGTAAYAALRVRQAARLARRSHPFDKLARPEGARLLVVGDSLAEGAGASSPASSLPGLLCRANPSLTVVNKGRAGARFADFLDQLEEEGRFDAVLIVGGAADVIGMTRDGALRDTLQRAAQRARVRSDLVIFVPPGNVGNAPAFLPPWNWWMSYRARRLQALVAEVAQANGACHVSLFRDGQDDPFARHPANLYAPDGLHPADAGYELLQRELEAQVQLSARLRKIGRSAAIRGPAF